MKTKFLAFNNQGFIEFFLDENTTKAVVTYGEDDNHQSIMYNVTNPDYTLMKFNLMDILGDCIGNYIAECRYHKDLVEIQNPL